MLRFDIKKWTVERQPSCVFSVWVYMFRFFIKRQMNLFFDFRKCFNLFTNGNFTTLINWTYLLNERYYVH